jgi:hypothetical protein
MILQTEIIACKRSPDAGGEIGVTVMAVSVFDAAVAMG